ncbi:MAG: hypothetical protein H6708_01720 [Kofleriaceae bacterium]|nr:hypothetical protein [Kofleriaceae bacterium]
MADRRRRRGGAQGRGRAGRRWIASRGRAPASPAGWLDGHAERDDLIVSGAAVATGAIADDGLAPAVVVAAARRAVAVRPPSLWPAAAAAVATVALVAAPAT